MPNWLNDASQFANGDTGGFNPTVDPSAFMASPAMMPFDQSQLPYQQMPPRMPGTHPPNSPPASQPSMYATQAVVPSKRPRVNEDGVSPSPHQYPGVLPNSNASQGGYPAYNNMANGAPQYGNASAFQQYPQASSTASQSPVMQNQAFNGSGANQNNPTVPASPFSPGMQGFAHQQSPTQSEHGSRVNTPQGGPQNFVQGQAYMATGPSHTPTPNPPANGPNGPPYNAQAITNHQQQMQMQQQRAQYEARVRQMQQYATMAGSHKAPAGMMNPMGQPPTQMQAYQMAQARAQPSQLHPQAQAQTQVQAQAQQRPQNVNNMLQSIMQFMQQRGYPFNPNPVLGGRPVNGAYIFMAGVKLHGSKRIHAQNLWPTLAQMVQFPPAQCMAAGQEIAAYWQSNLTAWESHFMQQQQQQARQRAMATANNMQGTETPNRHDQTPSKTMQAQFGQRQLQTGTPFQTPTQGISKTADGSPYDPRQTPQHGSIPVQAPNFARPPSGYGQPMQPGQRPSLPQGQPPRNASQMNGVHAASAKQPGPSNDRTRVELKDYYVPNIESLEQPSPKSITDRAKGAGDWEVPRRSRSFNRPQHHGGLPVTHAQFSADLDNLIKYKLSVPQIAELGGVDLDSWVLSLRSGIDGEVRYALDLLAMVSRESFELTTEAFDELLECLLDCASDQVKELANPPTVGSAALELSSYQNLIRDSKIECQGLQDDSELGTEEHTLRRSADRLICIVSILRNFTVGEFDKRLLVLNGVPTTVTSVIRHMTTQKLFLRTHANSLDFTKDAVVLFACLAPHMELKSRDEVISILHFLLSFAPIPHPSSKDSELSFSPYIPALHEYLPDAVDILASIMAHEATRSVLKSVFNTDCGSSKSSELLTRAFGLSIAAVHEVESIEPRKLGGTRLICAAQGLVAAVMLVDMIPGFERNLARKWLASQDCFAFKLKKTLSSIPIPPKRPESHTDNVSAMRSLEVLYQDRDYPKTLPEMEALQTVFTYGLRLLRKLVERTKDGELTAKETYYRLLPDDKSILQALENPSAGLESVKQLCLLESRKTDSSPAKG